MCTSGDLRTQPRTICHMWDISLKSYFSLKCMWIFAVLFTIAKTWKQPKCPLTEEWIKKTWRIYTMEYYSAIKKNEIRPFAAMWMDLEIVILSEVRQRRRNIIWHPLYVDSKKKWYKWTYMQNRRRLTDLENELMVARGKGWSGNLGWSCTHCYN